MNKLDLLLTPVWKVKHIMEYVECSHNKAERIRNLCIKEYGGRVKYEPTSVKTEAVLNYLGSSREIEIDLIKRSLNEKEKTL